MKNVFSILALSCLILAGCAEKNPVLTVEGGMIQGVQTESKGVTVYKGIPFAAAPVGDLRWKAPQPVTPWEGVKIADTWGAPSLQDKHEPGGYTPEFFFDGDPDFSEDCLHLNVWTPAAGKPEAKLPVCLWIHGGAYHAGWSYEPEMDGEEWAKHGVILVTANYRLGLLGFLSHPLLSAESENGVSGNYGMLDQIAAIKWVRDNIEQFGGDPHRITIMGQSAGARSVQTLVSSPLSKGLIAGAIIQSGGGVSENPRPSTPVEIVEAEGQKLMEWAGCTTLEQMRALPAEDFLTIVARYNEDTGENVRPSTSPINDSYVFPEDFNKAAIDGTISDVPYMIGCTSGDIGRNGEALTRFCKLREKSGNVAYAYKFARPLPTDGRENVLEGAFHSSELWYVFKSLRFCWRPFTEGDYDLAEQMITYWTNFVKFGNPNGEGEQVWTPCTLENPQAMIFKLDENNSLASAMGSY